MTKIVAVVGRMRTGTTALRQMIGSSDRSFDLGEVFHGNTSLNTNFWGFLNEICLKRPDLRHPASIGEAWDLFIEDQRNKLEREIFVIDAKVEYFPYIMRTDLSRNWLFFESSSVKCILIQRRNVLAQALSRIRATHTNSWSLINDEATAENISKFNHIRGNNRLISKHDAAIEIDVENLYIEVNNIHNSNNQVLNLLNQKFDLHLWYEDLFDNSGCFNSEVINAVSKLCGMKPDFFDNRPILKRQNTDGILSGLSNPEAVMERFSGTPFAWMLEP